MTVFTYLREFCRLSWLKAFFTVKTPPLTKPSYFRDFPELFSFGKVEHAPEIGKLPIVTTAFGSGTRSQRSGNLSIH